MIDCKHRFGAAAAFGLLVMTLPARAEDVPVKDAPAKDAPMTKDAPAKDAPAKEGQVEASSAAANAEKARSLFKEGRTLAAAGRFREACIRFEDSLRLDVGIGTQFNLADCLEHVGRLRRAQTIFLHVADLAHERGQDDRERVARERAHALEEAIPRVAIEAKELADGLEVVVDGDTVDRTNWATGVRVDPGRHDIIARAPHKKSWSLSVEVGEGAGVLMITVPKLEDGTPPTFAPPKAGSVEAPPKAVVHGRESKPGASRQVAKVLLLGSAGAGVVLAATGFAIYKMSNDNAKDVCPTSTGCTPDDIRSHEGFVDDAATARALGYVGLGVTGAALIGFTVFSLTSPPNREAGAAAAVSAGPLPAGGWGGSVRGSF